jgi:hypothetical protein
MAEQFLRMALRASIAEDPYTGYLLLARTSDSEPLQWLYLLYAAMAGEL